VIKKIYIYIANKKKCARKRQQKKMKERKKERKEGKREKEKSLSSLDLQKDIIAQDTRHVPKEFIFGLGFGFEFRIEVEVKDI
jgi:hypothetical protein